MYTSRKDVPVSLQKFGILGVYKYCKQSNLGVLNFKGIATNFQSGGGAVNLSPVVARMMYRHPVHGSDRRSERPERRSPVTRRTLEVV